MYALARQTLRDAAIPQLWWFSIRLSLGVAVVVMGILALGRIQSADNKLSRLGLTLCEDVACFRGLIPGRTSWQEAIAQFNGQSTLSGDPFYYHITVIPTTDGQFLDSVLL